MSRPRGALPLKRSGRFIVHLTVEERDTLLAHVQPPDALDALFANARVHGALVMLDLTGRECDEFLASFEQTANSAQNIEAMNRLGCAFARLEAGLTGEADPGWHLRPRSAD